MNLLYWLGAAVIVALSGYAGWLLGKLWQQRRRGRAVERLRLQQTCDSLEIIARSLVAGQVNVTEAALRMEVLLHNLDHPRPDADLSAVHALASQCGSLAIGGARQELSAEERARQDARRERAEAAHGDAVRDAAQRLLTVLPEWRPDSAA